MTVKKLAALFSSRKDSAYAIYLMKKKGYDIACLISMINKNIYSCMFTASAAKIVELQAEAMELPIIIKKTNGKEEEERNGLIQALSEAKAKYGIHGVITGVRHSKSKKENIERVCSELGLEVHSPIWGIDSEKEMYDIIAARFHIIFTSVAARGLNHGWLGRKISKRDINNLIALKKECGINVAGETGEFETLVIDCPMFKKKLVINRFTILEKNEFTSQMMIDDVGLVDK
ncbi:MAG: diphthine--ammonia ligase [Nanoarchaeota archaeon]|nr:diphthine--ammonia ligase [Nanoarchaeota archaeon]